MTRSEINPPTITIANGRWESEPIPCDEAARYEINVSDVQDAIQTAVGGNALTQVLVGEQRYDLVLRYLPEYRDTREAIEKIRLLAPTGERVSLALATTNLSSEPIGSSVGVWSANQK